MYSPWVITDSNMRGTSLLCSLADMEHNRPQIWHTPASDSLHITETSCWSDTLLSCSHVAVCSSRLHTRSIIRFWESVMSPPNKENTASQNKYLVTNYHLLIKTIKILMFIKYYQLSKMLEFIAVTGHNNNNSNQFLMDGNFITNIQLKGCKISISKRKSNCLDWHFF